MPSVEPDQPRHAAATGPARASRQVQGAAKACWFTPRG